MIHAASWKDDDILEVRVSDKPVAREISENWHIHKRYGADGRVRGARKDSATGLWDLSGVAIPRVRAGRRGSDPRSKAFRAG